MGRCAALIDKEVGHVLRSCDGGTAVRDVLERPPSVARQGARLLEDVLLGVELRSPHRHAAAGLNDGDESLAFALHIGGEHVKAARERAPGEVVRRHTLLVIVKSDRQRREGLQYRLAQTAALDWHTCRVCEQSAGVRRGDRADAARRKCPAIRLVHVETIGDDDDVEGATASGANDDGDAKRSDAPDRTRSKVVA